MCKHRFEFPEDKPENYNADKLTLTGRCKCGDVQTAYGMKWAIPIHDDFLQYFPYQETQFDPLLSLDNPSRT
mgnify:CR=1 FL=1